jgi:hypothetical protein
MFSEEFAAVFLQEVLGRLVQKERLGRVTVLRSVCWQWFSFVGRVTHLNLWEEGLDERKLEKILHDFSLVRSLGASANIFFMSCPLLSRIICLRIDAYAQLLKSYPISLAQWSGLHTLSYPESKYPITYQSLSDLSLLSGQLTTLIIDEEALPKTKTLGLMRQLRHLRLSGFRDDAAVVAALRLLTRLEYFASDRLAHFVAYTGRGRLKTFMSSANSLRPLMETCGQVTLRGEWQNGKFSGLAWLYSLDLVNGNTEYTGEMINGVREGRGVEQRYHKDDTLTVYRGNWKAGQLDGRVHVAYFDASKGQPLSKGYFQQWESGRPVL